MSANLQRASTGQAAAFPGRTTNKKHHQNHTAGCLGLPVLLWRPQNSPSIPETLSCSRARPSQGQHGIRAHAAAGEQPSPDEEIPADDASRAIMEEIAAEDAAAAEQLKGKEPVHDLFPKGEAARLSPKQQRERLAKLSGRPLRNTRAPRRPSRRSVDLLDTRGQPDIGSMGAVAKALDLRPQLPLPPVPRLEPLAARQAQADSASPYVPRQDGSEGIGSYARKIAEAGLDLSASPREVVYNHPMVAKARLDAAIAAGYDPDAEFRSMLGRLMTDDELEGAEVDEDRQKPEAQKQPQSTTPDLDTDFMEQLTEEERQSEEDVLNPEWDADMDVKNEVEEDNLAEDFDRALNESMAAKDEDGDDREGFAVWEGDEEEADSIDDIVSRLTEISEDRESSGDAKSTSRKAGQKKADLMSRKPKFSWRDFGPSRTPEQTD
ncbi:g5301 [Coccomyxa viridis]|uniref:G5301 protein n=1 Tax=Coccomyxa viridis TaxID=1274662 RepID=A0ABP1FSH8_9CHLO